MPRSTAIENNKLVRLPVIHRLKENSPREGFFEREQRANPMTAYESIRPLGLCQRGFFPQRSGPWLLRSNGVIFASVGLQLVVGRSTA